MYYKVDGITKLVYKGYMQNYKVNLRCYTMGARVCASRPFPLAGRWLFRNNDYLQPVHFRSALPVHLLSKVAS